uniref:BTB domain-containing protein n=1 Tax=Strongyloides papillosus TaxID=174720 RepID=A0A0N5CGP6_STREA
MAQIINTCCDDDNEYSISGYSTSNSIFEIPNNNIKYNSTGSIAFNDLNTNYQWTINNFFEILHSRESKLELESPYFSVLGYPNILFSMCLLLRNESSEGISYWGLTLTAYLAFSNVELTITIPHKFSLTSPTRNKIFWDSSFIETTFYLKRWTPNRFGVERRITLETIKESLFSSGTLNIVCEIMYKENVKEFIYASINNTKMGSRISNYKKHNSQLYEMYKLENTSDCKIVHRGKFFSVHKFILMAHSLVFRKLFMDPNSKESKGGCVTLCGTVESQTVEMMINYLYKGELPNNIDNKNIEELLDLAETYEINNLKLMCESMLNL